MIRLRVIIKSVLLGQRRSLITFLRARQRTPFFLALLLLRRTGLREGTSLTGRGGIGGGDVLEQLVANLLTPLMSMWIGDLRRRTARCLPTSGREDIRRGIHNFITGLGAHLPQGQVPTLLFLAPGRTNRALPVMVGSVFFFLLIVVLVESFVFAFPMRRGMKIIEGIGERTQHGFLEKTGVLGEFVVFFREA